MDVLFRVSEAKEELGYLHNNVSNQFNSCDNLEDMYVNENYLRLYFYCQPKH